MTGANSFRNGVIDFGRKIKPGMALWAETMKTIARGRSRRKTERDAKLLKIVNRFQVLTSHAGEGDLFTVAIDGLLNLRAKDHSLVCALRHIRQRIALQPGKVYLYRLGQDVLEDIYV